MAYKNVEARREYINNYQATKVKQCKFQLNREHDADIIEWLDGIENRQGYIKKLIRQDMKKQNG